MREQLISFNEKMEGIIAELEEDFGSIRAGRANPGILERLVIDYYGTPTKVNQMAAVSVSEARILVIQPWDRSALKLIEKALNLSDIGIPPQNDGTCIRLVFPPLTEERRKELSKEVRKHAEEAKIAVRNVRRDANELIKKQEKDKTISEDDRKDIEKDCQKLTDDFIKKVDDMADGKSAEIMEL
ncbi:MAG TPA: ribosome recycling factor [Oscillospiraceae bacterium]|nr:ribosome recycling factor [Oscillospiraceae bacterium]HNW04850.1 ribosome recycling factor [Oscillospiraceae bacterium]